MPFMRYTMATYSFLDVQATLVGPGGAVELGNGAGAAQEGITIAYSEDKGNMLVGADGNVMHSLRASQAGTITVRLLQTSPTNAKLAIMHNAQCQSSLTFGRNTITIRNSATGDTIVASQCAFAKLPDLTYAQDGSTYEWVFNCGVINEVLGTGDPEA